MIQSSDSPDLRIREIADIELLRDELAARTNIGVHPLTTFERKNGMTYPQVSILVGGIGAICVASILTILALDHWHIL